jgi:hypothetical protein
LHFCCADTFGITPIAIAMPTATTQIADNFMASSPSELSASVVFVTRSGDVPK